MYPKNSLSYSYKGSCASVLVDLILQQTNLANSYSKLALTTATSSAVLATSAIGSACEAVSEAHSEKTPKRQARRKAKAGDDLSVPAVTEMAMLPFNTFMQAFSPEEQWPKTIVPKMTAFENPWTNWAWPVPFNAMNASSAFFNPMSFNPLTVMFKRERSVWEKMADPFEIASGGAQMPFNAMNVSSAFFNPMSFNPMAAMFKRDRSVWEKMADPFEIASSGTQMPSWPMMQAFMPNLLSMPKAAFDPKMAAAMMALFLTPPMLQSATSTPWAGFGF